MTNRSPFHLVEFRPWPLIGSLRAFIIAIGLASWFHTSHILSLILGLILILIVIFNWWRDITRESTLQGFHTSFVINGIKWGILLFIASEIIFFLAFFWAFFHRSLRPRAELGCSWPPSALITINPFSIPLLNTAILLGSGVRVTWAHHRLLSCNKNRTCIGLRATVYLGAYFTFLQVIEYSSVPFSISDRVYGRTFFVATGFHGLHVLIGTSFLSVCILRNHFDQFSSDHHFGFEARAWYWHFVDVVWIFLYLCLYWWGC